MATRQSNTDRVRLFSDGVFAVLITILVGGFMRRALWELVLGALLSAGVAYLSLIVWILVACSGKTDCI